MVSLNRRRHLGACSDLAQSGIELGWTTGALSETATTSSVKSLITNQEAGFSYPRTLAY